MASWRLLASDLTSPTDPNDNAELARAIRLLTTAVTTAATTDIEEIAAVGAMHHLPWVRQCLVSALASRAPQHHAVRELVAWLTHDYEDFVAFEAIRLAGQMRLAEVLPELFLIVGRASQRLHHDAGKPVGLGHAVVLNAITAILETDSPHFLSKVEEGIFSDGEDIGLYPMLASRDASICGEHDHAEMTQVSGGVVRGGPPPSFEPGELVLDWNDPPEIGSCEDFWIDVLPVSNAEYDAFAFSWEAQQHIYCHPSEPTSKLHLRNTWLDDRSGRDHPVAGVDWFDAYAFARSRGKRLPNETEWQRAAEGDDRRAYPWGDNFDPARTHCLPAPTEPGWEGVLAWRADLMRMSDISPTLTTCARGIAGSASPYGVLDMSGNVWEWTASSFGGPVFSPGDVNRDAIDVIYDQRSYVVIKGGTWSSLPEQTSVAFRGRDLALDRHFEIGFRCVCDCRSTDQTEI